MTMNVSQIKNTLFKQATVFETGGFQPTNEIGESWIGKITWEKDGVEIPSNFEPLFSLFTESLPYVPDALKDCKLITVYID